jgi:hypothetical protein
MMAEKFVFPQWSSEGGNHTWGWSENWPSEQSLKDAAKSYREKNLSIRLDGFWRIKERK